MVLLVEWFDTVSSVAAPPSNNITIHHFNNTTIPQYNHLTIQPFTYFCTVKIYRKAIIIALHFFICICFASKTMAQQKGDTLREVEIKTSQVKDSIVDKRAEFSAGQSSYRIEKIYKDLYESQ